jgi:hypothetical protein
VQFAVEVAVQLSSLRFAMELQFDSRWSCRSIRNGAARRFAIELQVDSRWSLSCSSIRESRDLRVANSQQAGPVPAARYESPAE